MLISLFFRNDKQIFTSATTQSVSYRKKVHNDSIKYLRNNNHLRKSRRANYEGNYVVEKNDIKNVNDFFLSTSFFKDKYIMGKYKVSNINKLYLPQVYIQGSPTHS